MNRTFTAGLRRSGAVTFPSMYVMPTSRMVRLTSLCRQYGMSIGSEYRAHARPASPFQSGRDVRNRMSRPSSSPTSTNRIAM